MNDAPAVVPLVLPSHLYPVANLDRERIPSCGLWPVLPDPEEVVFTYRQRSFQLVLINHGVTSRRPTSDRTLLEPCDRRVETTTSTMESTPPAPVPCGDAAAFSKTSL